MSPRRSQPEQNPAPASIEAKADEAFAPHEVLARLQEVTRERNEIFVSLHANLGGQFWARARREGLTEEEATAAVQQTLINIGKGIGTYDRDRGGAGTARAWMNRICRHAAIDQLRARPKEVPLPPSGPGTLEGVLNGGPSPDEISEKERLTILQCLVTTVEGLSVADRGELLAGPPKAGPARRTLRGAAERFRAALATCLTSIWRGERG